MINHIAFILDGNRRYAKRLKKMPWEGHKHGAEKVKNVLKWCRDAGIKEVSMYAFSMQNFSRSKEEVDYLYDIFRKFFDYIKDEDYAAQNVKVRFIGVIERFPEDLYKNMIELMDATKDCDGYYLNLCVGYGGREELLSAIKQIAAEVESGTLVPGEIDYDIIQDHLWLQSEPDLIVRTSGERRTSNFLPWQATYSEWAFPKCFWPEFSKEDFDQILDDYKNRERRFGK